MAPARAAVGQSQRLTRREPFADPRQRLFLSRQPAARAGGAKRSCKVLIVDDDRALVSLLRVIFQDGGFDVRTANDGIAALEELHGFQPDVIVLDLEMPVMNGREFFREARGRGVTTPVLILSAYGARSAQIELGAEGYADKPFDPDDLVQAVLQLVQ